MLVRSGVKNVISVFINFSMSVFLYSLCNFFFADVNECLTLGACDHKCTNTEGSYKCSCMEGYVFEPPRTCRPQGNVSPNLIQICPGGGGYFLMANWDVPLDGVIMGLYSIDLAMGVENFLVFEGNKGALLRMTALKSLAFIFQICQLLQTCSIVHIPRTFLFYFLSFIFCQR